MTVRKALAAVVSAAMLAGGAASASAAATRTTGPAGATAQSPALSEFVIATPEPDGDPA